MPDTALAPPEVHIDAAQIAANEMELAQVGRPYPLFAFGHAGIDRRFASLLPYVLISVRRRPTKFPFLPTTMTSELTEPCRWLPCTSAPLSLTSFLEYCAAHHKRRQVAAILLPHVCSMALW